MVVTDNVTKRYGVYIKLINMRFASYLSLTVKKQRWWCIAFNRKSITKLLSITCHMLAATRNR